MLSRSPLALSRCLSCEGSSIGSFFLFRPSGCRLRVCQVLTCICALRLATHGKQVQITYVVSPLRPFLRAFLISAEVPGTVAPPDSTLDYVYLIVSPAYKIRWSPYGCRVSRCDVRGHHNAIVSGLTQGSYQMQSHYWDHFTSIKVAPTCTSYHHDSKS